MAVARTIGVGVIGTGGMGRTHAFNLHMRTKGADVVAIMDPDRVRAEQVARECGVARVFEDGLELIADERVEAVLIASPDPTHATFVRESLRRGKSVLVEKPLAATVPEAEEIVAAEVALGRRLVQVGFMRRCDPYHLAVKRTVESGAIGPPRLFRGWHRNASVSPRVTNAAVLVGSAIHDLDSARWMLGQEIEEVFVRGVTTDPNVPAGVYDLQLLQLSMTGGCLATIEVYLSATYGYEVGVEVVGERGTAAIAVPEDTVIRREFLAARRVAPDWLDRFAEAYIAEVQAWIRSLHMGRPALPDAWDGLVSLVAAESCLRSLESGAPVRVPWTERPPLYANRQVRL